MNFYQAGYYRQGMQGGSAGWGIVSPSRGMSQIAKDGFEGISANLVELKNTAEMPAVNYGIFHYDRFIYLLHVNYAASGEDARGVVFVHGYCINIADYYELCRNPERLFGIREDNFLMEYDTSQEQYPVRDALSYDTFSFEELYTKYRFTKKKYRNMILHAINTLEGCADPLCIKTNLPLEDYPQAYKELAYLVMMGLPCHMRSRMSSFSYSGSGSTVFVCSHAEGNNCIDLDAQGFDDAVFPRLMQYQFTQVYNMFDLGEEKGRENLGIIFNRVADAVEAMFQNPLYEACCSQIEAGFQASAKIKNDIVISGVEGICPKNVMDLLNSLLKWELKESETVYEYLGALLEVINDNSLRINDKRIVRHLSDGYDKTENAVYRKEVCRMMAGELLAGDREKGYAELNRLSVESGGQFAMIGEELLRRDRDFVSYYREDSYLPSMLTDTGKISQYLADRQSTGTGKEYKAILAIILDVVPRQLEKSERFSQRYEIMTEVDRILTDQFPADMKQPAAQVMRQLRSIFWEQFDMAEFSLKYIDKYGEMKPEEVEQASRNGREITTAGNMVCLLNVVRGQDGAGLSQTLYKILFTDVVFGQVRQKEELQRYLRTNRIGTYHEESAANEEGSFDGWLALFYDFNGRRFDTVSWAKEFSASVSCAFDSAYISGAVQRSRLMAQETLKRAFLESLASDIRSAKQDAIDPSIIKGLKRYKRCVSGKKIREDQELEARRGFVHTMCRIPVGSLMFLAIGVLLNEKILVDDGYMYNEFTVLLAGGVFLMLLVMVFVSKVFCMQCDLDKMMKRTGLKGIVERVVYFMALGLCLAGVVAVLLLGSYKVTIIAAAAYLVTAVVGVIAESILTRE